MEAKKLEQLGSQMFRAVFAKANGGSVTVNLNTMKITVGGKAGSIAPVLQQMTRDGIMGSEFIKGSEREGLLFGHRVNIRRRKGENNSYVVSELKDES